VSKGTTILVLGASGMLGSEVHRRLASRTESLVDTTQRVDSSAPDYLDLLEMSREDWGRILKRRPYRFVVNCLGILKPAINEADMQSLRRAIVANALFPHELAAMLPESRIIHISTDGVFSGAQERPYVETDATDCADAYGKSKALGECPARNVVNIRCSVVGRDPAGGKGLIEWVLRAPEGAELTGFEDHVWNGVTTNQLAELCRRIIECDAFESVRAVSGVHHFCPNPPITKYDLVRRVRDAARRDLRIRRGQSGRALRRTLGTIHPALPQLYPCGESWESLLSSGLEAGCRH
jgi:dTDP-4-dehydrorhamnose reductase